MPHRGVGPLTVGLGVPSAVGPGGCVRSPGSFIAVAGNEVHVTGFPDGKDDTAVCGAGKSR